MDIKRLRLFERNLERRIEYVNESTVSSAVFYLVGRKWFAADGQEASARGLKSNLDQTKRSGATFRPKNERTVFFWVSELDVVAQVAFSVAIRQPAQNKALGRIQQIRDDSLNEFSATHDPLTGLKNRSAFDRNLIDALELARATQSANSDSAIAEAVSLSNIKSGVILASLDIDHFKTVNDRFGHGYGDVVLAALSRRIEIKAKKIEQEFPSKCAISVYRLGGEEFQVLLTGALQRKAAFP